MKLFDAESNPTLAAMCDAADVSENGVIWLQADGRILSINESLYQELGYENTEDIPTTIFEINPSMSLLAWRKFWKKMNQNRKVTFDSEHITFDQSIYPVKVNTTLVKIEEEAYGMYVSQNLMEANRYEEMLAFTSQIAGIGSWEWDLINNEFVFNDEMYRLLELPAQMEITEDTLQDFITKGLSESELKVYGEKIKAAVAHGTPFEFDYSFGINGKFKNFNLNAHPVVLEEQTIKIYGTLQNVGNISKRTDDMYFTKYSMDYARDMIYWISPDGMITYVNQTAFELLEYSSDELLNQSIKKIDLDFSQDLNEFWEDLKKEKSIEFDTIHTTKKGKKIPVSVTTNYINYRGKEFNCAFVRNLSKKKKRDELLEMSKHSLDQSLDMIFWINEDGSFRFFNDAFVQKTGYPRAKIEQMKVFDFFTDSNQEIFSNGWAKLKAGAIIEGMERDLEIKGGSIIICEMNITMVVFEQNEFSVIVLRDITGRKQKEAKITNQLQEIERLQAAIIAENIALKEEIDIEFNFSNIITRDPNYKRVLRQVEQVADTDATVLILGETGTGKELLARAIHQLSEREDLPMIKVNCGALPENLIESELFGHEKGSFTGAHQQKIGKFERADKGTIFLDEIGELPLDLQAKLLRVLQEGEIERVGGIKTLKIDVRIIAATNRDLQTEVIKGTFREDLFYRLNVFPINNIPLRERREDIPILVKHFAEKYAKKINKEISEISQSAMNKLMTYNFLGNVRELENLVERAVILSKGKVLNFDLSITRKTVRGGSAQFLTMDAMQKKHIVDALRRTKGKVSGKGGAAELLEMNGKTLTSRMLKLGIKKQDYLKK